MDKHVFTAKQKKLIGWASIAIFLLLSAVVGWFVGRPLVRFASQPEQFRQWVDGHGLMGCAAYVGMVFLQVVVAVIPGEPLEISGGYAFGAVRGSLLCLLGAFLGSVAVFALVRRFGRELVDIFFPREKLEKLKFLAELPQAGRSVLAGIHGAGHAQGPAVLLRRADGPVLGQVAAAVYRGPPAVGTDLHHRRRRPGREGLPVRDAGFCRHPGGVRRGAADLPALCRRHQRRQEHV